MSALHNYLRSWCVAALLIAANTTSAAAQTCESPQTLTSCTPAASITANLGGYYVTGLVYDLGDRGFITAVTAKAKAPGDESAGHTGPPGFDPKSLPSGTDVRPIMCRRDDYAFLPPGALSGIPCDSSSSADTTDPHQIARAMWDQMDMPSIRLGMNPQLGMVAVPTWFWVDGYDGDVIPLTDNLVLTHQECHTVLSHDANGLPELDATGTPITHQECHPLVDTMTVEVRAWSKAYEWSFGDQHGKTIYCADIAACPAGLGQPYTDPASPSPIAHAYQWSSLGANGAADAYTIGLQITFGAQYRFSTNGGALTDWQALDDRDLTWTASHQVREAQAVLSVPDRTIAGIGT